MKTPNFSPSLTPSLAPNLAMALATLVAAVVLCGCTGQVPGSFRFIQQEQTFSTAQDVNTKIDLLWVVDNSSSMDVHQKKLRDGFNSFAKKYLKPTWDIRVAVITTDTFLAASAFNAYLNRVVPGSVGYTSTYLSGLSWLSSYKNPSWNPRLVNTSNGRFDNGIKYGELNPLWGTSYSRLLAGVHDGPITSLCFEGMPYFLNGLSKCGVRDNSKNYNGSKQCLNPNVDVGESSMSQCINTIQNDTVRSGNPIIATVPPSGTAGDDAWTMKLVENFTVNASVGSSGSGSERGLASLLQLLDDNEGTSSSFFRAGSLRGIVFLSDEDDQSLQIPSPLPDGFGPEWGYKCDQASLLSGNANSSLINGSNGICCDDPAKGCKYGSIGISCPTKTIDGFTYRLGICADPTKLIPVADVKSKLDTFFGRLDSGGSDANYFVFAITPSTASSVRQIQSSRQDIEVSLGTVKVVEADRGDRYIQLAQMVGSGSQVMDISATDYSPILNAIGNEIVEKKSKFQLGRAPTGKEEMIIKVIHQDGSATVLRSDQYVISGKTITFTNQDFVLSLSRTDRVSINYQPKTAY